MMDTLGITVPFSRGGRLDVLTSGQELLADASSPTASRCMAAA